MLCSTRRWLAATGKQQISADTSFTQRYSQRLPQWLRDVLPIPKPELRFKDFRRQPGYVGTLGGIVAVNSVVFLAWQQKASQNFMERHFVNHNDDLSEGRWWTLLTSSISHNDFNHIMGNMCLFLVLAKPLHDLVGRARFCLLYVMGAVGGGVATELDPASDADSIERSPKRYGNILMGNTPGQSGGLGASDAVMAVVAAFYLTFPRTPVPIFRRFYLATQIIRPILPGIADKLGKLPILNVQMSAIWLLPLYFIGDWQQVYTHVQEWRQNPDSYVAPMQSVGHAAHAGGMLGGALFYALIAHPIKRVYYNFTLHELWRRVWIMTVSFFVSSGAMFRLMFDGARQQRSSSMENADPVVVFVHQKEVVVKRQRKDGSIEQSKEVRKVMFSPEDRGRVSGAPTDLLVQTNSCVLHEYCRLHSLKSMHSQMQTGSLDKLGMCDKYFKKVHNWLEEHQEEGSLWRLEIMKGPSQQHCSHVLQIKPNRKNPWPWPHKCQSGLFMGTHELRHGCEE